MSCFAIYRLPHKSECTLLIQSNNRLKEFYSLKELNGLVGFVVAPFVPSEKEPILLFQPDKKETLKLRECHLVDVQAAKIVHPIDDVTKYSEDFHAFHQKLVDGEFKKIVLSRCSEEITDNQITPEELFEQACSLYPRMFIALISSPQCGTWLIASPETLLEGDGHKWKTVALAGTKKLNDEEFHAKDEAGENSAVIWDNKNIEEQQIVASYIHEQLENFTDHLEETDVTTVRAGNLLHRKSDFFFRLKSNEQIGDLLDKLYPTPAVCGIPKEKTKDFIKNNESSERHYYSGFIGPLNPSNETHLYVSLRCMQIDGNNYKLYAGGGLLNDSTEKSEWDETEAKLETMRKCIATKKM